MTKGTRKIVMLALGLVALLVAGAMVPILGLPLDGLGELTWPIWLLTATALGANVGEHFAQRGGLSMPSLVAGLVGGSASRIEKNEAGPPEP